LRHFSPAPLTPVDSVTFFRTDGQMRTGTPGVYAAGDIARAPHNVMFAGADIMMAGLCVHHDLIGL
jgi:thioredoxin reductase